MSVRAEYTTEEILAPEFDDEIHYDNDLFESNSKLAKGATLPPPDDFDEQVEMAQQQLNALRHQQELIEQQKLELETLSKKQADFVKGKRDTAEKLNRSLAQIDRETEEAHRKIEEMAQAKNSFRNHLSIIQHLTPEHWSRDELRNDLEHAISALEDASEEFVTVSRRLDVLRGGKTSTSTGRPSSSSDSSDAEKDFRYWLQCGFAFTLPLMAFGLVAMLLLLMFS